MVGGSNPPSPTFNQGSLNLRGNGITYDTGFFNAGVSTHEPFEPDLVKREMHIIHDDLHCNAVRVTGGNADRLEIAATHAAGAGLEVWFCPFTCDLTSDDMLMLIDDCAQRAVGLVAARGDPLLRGLRAVCLARLQPGLPCAPGLAAPRPAPAGTVSAIAAGAQASPVVAVCIPAAGAPAVTPAPSV